MSKVPKPAMQIGYVVTDLNESIARWVGHTGIGPWTVLRNTTLHGCFAGQETVVTMDVAMGYTGELQIELIQVTSSTPSPYTHESGQPRVGPHHIAWTTDNLDETLAEAQARGLELLFFAEGPGTRVAYVHSPTHPGAIFEYIQSEQIREMVASGVEQARAWDGTEPVRVVT